MFDNNSIETEIWKEEDNKERKTAEHNLYQVQRGFRINSTSHVLSEGSWEGCTVRTRYI